MVWVGLAAMALACALALSLGARPEREAALLILGCWLVSAAGQLWLGDRDARPVAAADVLYGLGLLILVARHRRRWLWMAVALQAVVLLVHAFGIAEWGRVPWSYAVAHNSLSFAALAALVFGVLVESPWRARAKSLNR